MAFAIEIYWYLYLKSPTFLILGSKTMQFNSKMFGNQHRIR